MIAWTTVQAAIHAWVVSSSGLSAGNVIWSDQPGPRPSSPYIVMAVTGLIRIGQDAKNVTAVPFPTPGAEININLRGTRVLVLGLQCFDGSPVGAASGVGILEDVRTKQRLPTTHGLLSAAGVNVTRCGDIGALTSGSLGAARFEPRALMEVRINLSSEVTELATYIEVAEVTDDTRHKTFIVDSTP